MFERNYQNYAKKTAGILLCKCLNAVIYIPEDLFVFIVTPHTFCYLTLNSSAI